MLSSPDAALAEREPLLPGLVTVLDAPALTNALAARGIVLPFALEASYIRFKPSTACLVGYRREGTSCPPVLYATALREGSAKIAKSGERTMVVTAYGAGRMVIDGQAVEACVFPNDNHLPTISRLADPERRRKLLRRELPHAPRARRTSFEVLSWKPERRCVTRATDKVKSAVLRTYSSRAFASAHLRARAFASHESPLYPRLIGQTTRRHLLMLEWLPGQTLAARLAAGTGNTDIIEETGRQLAAFNTLPIPGLPVWSTAAVARRLEAIVRVLAILDPGQKERAAGAAERIVVGLQSHSGASATLHGDFNAKQVLLGRNRIAFLDLDEAFVGPEAFDAGNFIAHLHLSATSGLIGAGIAEVATEALLRGYSSTSIASNAVHLFTALGIMRFAHEPFRQHRAAWPREIERLLDGVEAQLRLARC